jgi:hypothetical protein
MIFSAPAVAHPVVVVHHLTPSIAAAAYQLHWHPISEDNLVSSKWQ